MPMSLFEVEIKIENSFSKESILVELVDYAIIQLWTNPSEHGYFFFP